MAAAVSDIYTDANVAMPDMATGTTDSLRWLNVVHKDLCEEFRLLETFTDLTLTTSAREYALAETYVTAWAAEYRTSATAQPFPIYETSIPELDAENQGWRNDNLKGQPTLWYQDANATGGAVIGFDKIPATASSGGYPTVRVWVSNYTAFTATGDLIPAVCRDHMVYVWGLCYQFAKMRHRDELAQWEAIYQEAKNELGIYLQRRQRNNTPRAIPMIKTGVAAR